VFSVRNATEDDLGRVRDIKVDSWQDTYAPLIDSTTLQPFLDRPRQLESLRKTVALPGVSLLVAEDGAGVVAGFSLVYALHDPEPWLESLHVAAAMRGRGIGTTLMAATTAGLIAAGYQSLRLGVVVGNVRAAHFYERLGGTMIGEEPATWGQGVFHWIYRWPQLVRLLAAAGQ